MALADQYQHKTATEVRNIAISFAPLLDVGELLTGAPSITTTPSGLTIDDEQVNTERRTVNDKLVEVGKCVQCSVAGGVAGQQYKIVASCDTDSTPSQTLEVTCYLDIEDE